MLHACMQREKVEEDRVTLVPPLNSERLLPRGSAPASAPRKISSNTQSCKRRHVSKRSSSHRPDMPQPGAAAEPSCNNGLPPGNAKFSHPRTVATSVENTLLERSSPSTPSSGGEEKLFMQSRAGAPHHPIASRLPPELSAILVRLRRMTTIRAISSRKLQVVSRQQELVYLLHSKKAAVTLAVH